MKNNIKKILITILVGIYSITSTTTLFAVGTSNNNLSPAYIKNVQHGYITGQVYGYNFNIIKVDTSAQSEYKIMVGVGGKDGQTSSFLEKFAQKYQALSGINGAYFTPMAYGNSSDVSQSERIVNGTWYNKWSETGDRVIFAFDKNGKTFLYQTDKINTNRKKDIYNGLGNFPIYLKDGKDSIYLTPSTLITSKMKEKKDKTFICSNKDDNTVYMGIVKAISITDMPKVLKSFGCYTAINLDAGASTSMMYNLDMKVQSYSPIMDGFFVVRKNGLTKTELTKLNSLNFDIGNKSRYQIYLNYQGLKSFF